MDLIQFIKKYQLILVLSFIAISLGVIKITYGYKENLNDKNLIPSITPIITKEVESAEISMEESNLASSSAKKNLSLPYTTKDFIVEDFDNLSTFKVKLLSEDKASAIQGIITWLEENDLNPAKYQVVFNN